MIFRGFDERPETARATVSVCMLTYRHAAFLKSAIEGVLKQAADFSIELIISDDASPDGTQEIARAFERRHPDRIILILNDDNIGLHRNARQAFKFCRGEYVSYCEGDDYWTDPLKLSKQVSFLRSHQDISLVFHSVNRKPMNSTQSLDPWIVRNGRYGLNDILRSNFIPSPSVTFRNSAPEGIPDWVFRPEMPMIDWPLFVHLLMHGEGYGMSDPMATYRVHHGGAWGGISEKQRIEGFIAFHTVISKILPEPLSRLSRRSLSNAFLSLSQESRGHFREEWKAFSDSYRALDSRDLFFGLAPRIRRLLRIVAGRLSPGEP